MGFLREIEAAAGIPLASFFDAIYGTSTGAIIGSLIALGKTVSETLELYKTYVPQILGAKKSVAKSAMLKAAADKLFEDFAWSDFKTPIGIVATNWTQEKPLVFKDRIQAASGLKATFVAGFGCTISDAVRASCSATPFFDACELQLSNVGKIEARDGGFCANNPALFALADALNNYHIPAQHVRLLSLGVGHYPEPKRNLYYTVIQKLPSVRLLQRALNVNANTVEIQSRYLFPNVPQMRISDRFEHPDLAMDFLEADLSKLNLLVQKGRESFSQRETQLREFFNNYATR